MSISSSIAAGSKKIYSEANKLSPSTLISFYELDFNEFGINRDNYQITQIYLGNTISPPYMGLNNCDDAGILRFHNLNMNLENTSTALLNEELFGQLIWQGKRYIPFPITIEGFEMASRGTLPKPKLRFSNQVQIAAYNNFFTIIKNSIRSIGDIIGLSVTRKRSFLKYLDAINFKSNGGIINNDDFQIDPDPYAELPPDIYYIDRKIRENKSVIEYELSSILDLENLRLPLRSLYSESCSLEYRGEGCEYGRGVYPNQLNGGLPVANDKDQLLTSLLAGAGISDYGQWTNGGTYGRGVSVYVIIDGVRHYFTAKTTTSAPPFDTNYWIADQCSKRINGCRKRFSSPLPFGGFPATNKDI